MAEEDSATAPPSQLLEPWPKSTGKVKKPMEKKSDESKTKRKRKHSFTKTMHAESNEHGNSTSVMRTKSTVDGTSPHLEANSAIGRALEVQSNLEPAFPSFVKTLLRSHCQDRYRMGLPGYFSREYLPHEDVTLVIENEDGVCYETRYFSRDAMLGAGWRQFCHAHQLKEGDVLVFQLVEPTKLKAYIVKIDNLNEVDGALGLLGLDASAKRLYPDDDRVEEKGREPAESEHLETPCSSYHRRKKKKKLPEQTSEQSRNQSEEIVSEVLEGSKSGVCDTQFEGIRSLEDFKILVNGKVMDSEFPEDIRRKYYELCLSQGSFLHANIVEGINDQLVASSISETVSVADAIRSCNRGTARVTAWDRTLKALEMLGMNVGFLRDRVKRLMGLNFDSDNTEQRYKVAERERARASEEIRKMEARLKEMKEEKEKLSAEVESLRVKAESLRVEYLEEATAPW
ncbi:hypothetical protein CDL15_Pgr013452 [Punica granatum]|uniref:TF-B3 domain-containing protein n=1 Tax=Punica granatum TaxID=22663 RepID=A0A218W0F7_PUNGR|nr:hypothetical protein CDL15_Pgr013452 [Punica granatum]